MRIDSERRNRPLYVRDEHAWMAQQITVMRDGNVESLDRDHLIHFLSASIAKNHRELRRRLTMLFRYLLDVRLNSDRVLRRWVGSILDQQRQINEMLRVLPSLRDEASMLVDDAYRDAVNAAAVDVVKRPDEIPSECPWTLEEALRFDVMPIIRRSRTSGLRTNARSGL